MRFKSVVLGAAIALMATVANADQILVTPDGKYLGNVNNNRFDPNSISNQFGRYGSQFSPDSVNNQFGRYGSQFSNDSARNPFATNKPFVVDDY